MTVRADLEVFSSSTLNRDEWSKLVNGSGYANLFQDEDWATFRENEGEKSLFFVTRKEPGQLAGIRIWKRQTRLGAFLESAGGPLCYPGSEALANDLLAKSIRTLRPGCIAGGFLFSPAFTPVNLRIFDGVNRNRVTFVIDVKGGKDDLWKRLSKSAKWSVNTANRRGIVVEKSEDLNQWTEFHRIHVAEALRKGFGNLALSSSASKWMYDVLRPKGKCVLLVASIKDKVVAGSLLYISNQTMHWVKNASDPRHLSYQPNDALLWNAITLGNEMGVSMLDLFGATKDRGGRPNGIYQFKSKWGGREVPNPVYLLGRVYSLAQLMQGISPRIRRALVLLNSSLVGV